MVKTLRGGKTIPFSLEWADIILWRDELMPVILVMYDIAHDTAYWLYMQQFCESTTRMHTAEKVGRATVYLRTENVMDAQAVAKFREFKQHVLDQVQGKVKHHG